MKRKFFLLFLIFIFVGCGAGKTKVEPEESLLGIFKLELDLVDRYENDYVGYMQYQVEHFSKKDHLISEAIEKINKKYNSFSDEEEKAKYVKYWNEQFQPIVNKIYDRTRNMIIKQTSNLTPEKMAMIQVLAV